ncbi:MAG: type II toxin-antitoxin system VapB family antitoxin [Methanoregulaceae archaeon]|nr:type II toxin-antitoxin system VapB family antitoxin [Methanoregulaceae archaeon]
MISESGTCHSPHMATNLNLDDELIREVFELCGCPPIL